MSSVHVDEYSIRKHRNLKITLFKAINVVKLIPALSAIERHVSPKLTVYGEVQVESGTVIGANVAGAVVVGADVGDIVGNNEGAMLSRQICWPY